MDLNDHLSEIEFTYKNFPKVFSTLRYFILPVLNVNYKIEKLNLYTRNEFGPLKQAPFYHYQCFCWYATLENKTPGETFPNFPTVLHVIDRSDQFTFLLMDTHVIRTSTTRALWLLSQSFLQFSNLSKVLKFLKDIFNSEISCRNNKLIAGPRVVQFRE